MPTLLDYPGVSWKQTESPTLPYESPNLPDHKTHIFLIYFGRLFVFWGFFFDMNLNLNFIYLFIY